MQGCNTTGLDGRDGPSIKISRLDCNNSTNPHKCRVNIERKIFKFDVDVDEIHLVRNSSANPNTNVDIVWHLPSGYVFCKKAANDGGVFLKGIPDGQFDGMYSTDDSSGAPPGDKDCKKHQHFHWNAKNTVPNPDGYRYGVFFYDKMSGAEHSIDPWIYND